MPLLRHFSRRSPAETPHVAFRILVLGALSLAQCHRTAEPCIGATCGSGSECLANRCVPTGGEPVPADSIRRVHEPNAIAAVSRDGLDTATPAIVAFGSSVERSTTLYLRFQHDWSTPAPITNAFLLLEPASAAPVDPVDVPVDVLRVEEDWDPRSMNWAHRPELIPLPRGRGLARSSPPAPLRVDVTELVRRARDAGSELSFAVRADQTTGGGARYSTGAGGGPLPRLEIYYRRL